MPQHKSVMQCMVLDHHALVSFAGSNYAVSYRDGLNVIC
jgi:hypothetical protein